MIITSLKMKNFKSHKNTTLNFNENISLILGKNGAGKSSILEAISYSLFKEYNGKKIENILRKSKEDDDVVKEMSVTLEFIHEGIFYKLERGKKGKSSTAKLSYKENGRYVMKCEKDRNVSKDIESILKLDSKSFLNAVYIRQGDITDLIDKNPSERKELIAKLLNIDSFETAWNEIKELKKVYEDKVNINTGLLSNKDNLEKDNDTILIKINQNKEKLKNLKPELDKLKTLLQEEELELSKLENNKIKYDNLVEKRDMVDNNLNKRIKENSENKKKLEELETDEKKIQSLKKDVEKLPHLEELMNTKAEFNENINQIEELKKIIHEIEVNTQVKNDKQYAHDQLGILTKEIEAAKQRKDNLNEKYTEYKTLNTQINDKKKKVNTIRKDLQKASENATKLFNEYFNSPESIENKVNNETKKTKQYIDTLNTKISENENKISVLRNNLETTKKSLKELELTEDTCPICQSEISHDKHEELSRKYNMDITNISMEIEKYEDHNKNQNETLENKKEYLDNIKTISIDVLKEKNNEFKTLNDEINELNEKISEYSNIESLVKEIDAEIKEKESKEKTLQDEDKAYYHAIENLKKLGNPDEKNREIDELNNINSNLKNKCHKIIIKYAVGDNLTLQIKNLKEKEKKLNILTGRVQDKRSLINKIKELTDEIADDTNSLNLIKEEIKSIEYDEEVYNNKNDTYTSNKEKFNEKDKLKIELDTEIRKDEESIAKNNDELEKLEEIAQQQNNLKEYLKLLDKIRDIYSKDGVQKDLRENVKPLIEKETLDIFNKFDFDYTDLTLDEDYTIKLYNKLEELDTSMISGGEKIVIALALRLGIAKVLSENKTDLLILDEPTIHLDEDRRKSLINIISEINFVPQMIIVTHDEEMESLSNNIIKIIKQDGISAIDDS